MRKLFLSVLICLLSIMPAFSAVIDDHYISNSFGMVCLDKAFVYDLIGWSKPENKASSEATKIISENIKERFGFDLENDIENIGIFVTPIKRYGPSPIFFYTGKLENKKIISVLKGTQTSDLFSKFSEGTIKYKDKELPTVNIDGNLFVFINDNLILSSSQSMMNNLLEGDLAFSKAPQEFIELRNHTGSFIHLSNTTSSMLKSMGAIPNEINAIKDCESVSIFVKDSLLRIEAYFKDNGTAATFKTQLESLKTANIEKLKKDVAEHKNALKTVELSKLSEQFRKLYATTSSIDFINSANVTAVDKSTIVTVPFELSSLTLGGSSFMTAILMPKVQKEQAKQRCKSCLSNLELLKNVIEQYNKDNSEKMTKLEMNKLLEGKYLEIHYVCPEDNSEYESEGDLTNGGEIKCKNHGTITKPTPIE